ncbi:MAG: sugar ABC transporter permease [Clostridiales bacterium]|nr:sugar ABC transporter permease [Clostridiales bacterium]
MAKQKSGISMVRDSSRKLTPLQHFWRDKWLLLLLLPTIVALILFNYVPMYGLAMAFQNYKIGSPIIAFDGSVEWVGLKHFKDFITSIFFTRVFGNTLRLSFENILFGFWVPILFALLLNEIKTKWYKKITQTFVYLPYFVSTVIVVSILMNMVSSEGVVNRLIMFFGGKSIPFMQKAEYFDFLYIVSQIWQTFGYSSIIYLAGIASIDPTLYEAATIDGGHRLHMMWHITIPGILPTAITLLILAIGGVLGSNTDKILLMYSAPLYSKADVIGTYVYRIGLVNAKYSYTAAVGLFSNVVSFILVFGANMLSRKFTDYSLW